MPRNKRAERLERQRRTQSRSRTKWIALGVGSLIALGIIFFIWQSTATSNVALGETTAIGSQVSNHPTETDIAGLQLAEAGKAGEPVLVWFHADWCQICQTLKRQGTVTALQKQYEGKAKIIMVNVDTGEARPYVGKYNVRGTPTFVLFDQHGRVVNNFSGWPGSPAVARYFDQVLAQQ